MSANERLRTALLSAGLTSRTLAEAVGVDPKTAERWVSTGRTPHPGIAHRAAIVLREDVAYLWPAVERGRRGSGELDPELVAVYATRADAPIEAWRTMFEQAQREIGILVYAAVHLHEVWPDFNDLLRARAAAGCRIRIALGDPNSAIVSARGREEKYGHGIETRCRVALLHYSPLVGVPGIDVHQHATTLYNSIYLGDDQMIVNTHRFGINAYGTPVLRIRRRGIGGLFDGYIESFDAAWTLSWPAKTDAD